MNKFFSETAGEGKSFVWERIRCKGIAYSQKKKKLMRRNHILLIWRTVAKKRMGEELEIIVLGEKQERGEWGVLQLKGK